MKQIKISKAAWVLQMSEPLIQAKKKKKTQTGIEINMLF